MSKRYFLEFSAHSSILTLSIFLVSCGAPPTTTVNSTSNGNTIANFNASTSNANSMATSGDLNFVEPNEYQAFIKMTLQTMGEQQNASMPPLGATVARSGENRVMEFTLPTNEKVTYIEKGNMKYVVLPSRRQYAELTADALGFEVRRLMMPEQIVNQLKGMPGVKMVGEETLNGRPVVKYTYQAAANTGTQAGTVATESYFLIDKETGLPVRSEIVSQSTSGGNVQGVKGLRLLTEMSEIKPVPDRSLFDVPTDYQKIDPEQVKAQANLIFQAAAAVIRQMLNQAEAPPRPMATYTPNP